MEKISEHREARFRATFDEWDRVAEVLDRLGEDLAAERVRGWVARCRDRSRITTTTLSFQGTALDGVETAMLVINR